MFLVRYEVSRNILFTKFNILHSLITSRAWGSVWGGRPHSCVDCDQAGVCTETQGYASFFFSPGPFQGRGQIQSCPNLSLSWCWNLRWMRTSSLWSYILTPRQSRTWLWWTSWAPASPTWPRPSPPPWGGQGALRVWGRSGGTLCLSSPPLSEVWSCILPTMVLVSISQVFSHKKYFSLDSWMILDYFHENISSYTNTKFSFYVKTKLANLVSMN